MDYKGHQIETQKSHLKDANGRNFYNVRILENGDIVSKINNYFYSESDAIAEAKAEIDEY